MYILPKVKPRKKKECFASYHCFHKESQNTPFYEVHDVTELHDLLHCMMCACAMILLYRKNIKQ